jgi:cyclic lactone autoinducer peptide
MVKVILRETFLLRGEKPVKKLVFRAAGLMTVLTAALAVWPPFYGQGCGMFLYQPKVPVKLRDIE